MHKEKQILVVLNRILPLSHQIQEGILRYVSDHRLPWELLILHLIEQDLSHARKWGIDGCIAVITTGEMHKWAKALHIPVVNTNGVFPTPGIAQIDADPAATGKLAARHFLDAGFQQFIALGVSLPGHLDRLRGFQKEVEQQNLQCPVFTHPARDVSFIPFFERHLSDALKSGARPLAAYFSDDGTAQMAVRTCKRTGINVPHEVAVLGTENNTYLCEGTVPRISSVRLPYQDIGYHAAKLLHLIFQKKKVPQLTLRPPVDVVQRASTDVLAVQDAHLAKALRYIREHAFEPLSVNNIAVASGIARRSLEERFARYLNRSPLEEITRLRLERAMHLLRNSRLDMDSIAEQCGLTTANYLSEAFRKKIGITPKVYRHQFNLPS